MERKDWPPQVSESSSPKNMRAVQERPKEKVSAGAHPKQTRTSSFVGIS